jgi:hypothetical protein
MTNQYSIYESNHNGEKRFVLSAPTQKEAEWAFDELRRSLLKYKDAEIEWQFTFFDDEVAIGEIV